MKQNTINHILKKEYKTFNVTSYIFIMFNEKKRLMLMRVILITIGIELYISLHSAKRNRIHQASLHL